MNDIARFSEKYTVNAQTGCWEWKGSIDKRGYARFLYNNKNWLAHKYAYATFKSAPSGYIQRTCSCSSCVNPAHWEEGKNKGRPVTVSAFEISRLYKEGLSAKQIAQELNCDPSLVRKRVRELIRIPEGNNH